MRVIIYKSVFLSKTSKSRQNKWNIVRSDLSFKKFKLTLAVIKLNTHLMNQAKRVFYACNHDNCLIAFILRFLFNLPTEVTGIT